MFGVVGGEESLGVGGGHGGGCREGERWRGREGREGVYSFVGVNFL